MIYVRSVVNSRLDTVQAAILDVKITAFINHELDEVNKVYKKYNSLLSDIVEITIIPQNYLSSFAQYTIKLKSQKQRDELKSYLGTKGIPTMIYYTKTILKQTAFKNLDNNDEDYPVSTKLCKSVLSLQMHPYLSDTEIEFISKSIIEFINKWYVQQYDFHINRQSYLKGQGNLVYGNILAYKLQ